MLNNQTSEKDVFSLSFVVGKHILQPHCKQKTSNSVNNQVLASERHLYIIAWQDLVQFYYNGWHLIAACSRVKPSVILRDSDTFGINCQRPAVFALGVPTLHKVTQLWKFEVHWSSKLRENNGRKKTLVTQSCVLSDAWNSFQIIILVKIYFFHENYVAFSQCFIL